MKSLLTVTALGLAIAGSAAWASEPTEKDAIALVEKGAAFMKDHGKEEMMKHIDSKDPEFYHGALYLHMRDAKTGVMLAHPVNPALIGKDLTDVPDTNGKKYRRDILELAASKGKGWVDYTYKNPATGKVEPKNTYIMRVGDVVLESGIYKK
jgi:signal transduction histidine kinase